MYCGKSWTVLLCLENCLLQFDYDQNYIDFWILIFVMFAKYVFYFICDKVWTFSDNYLFIFGLLLRVIYLCQHYKLPQWYFTSSELVTFEEAVFYQSIISLSWELQTPQLTIFQNKITSIWIEFIYMYSKFEQLKINIILHRRTCVKIDKSIHWATYTH